MDVQDPQFKTPDGSAVRIWRDTAKNNFLSESLGRPVFDEAIYAEVISPGSRDSAPVFELVRVFAPEMNHPLPMYGMKYEELKGYVADFEKTEDHDGSLAGTPLSQWAEIPRTLAATLKANNIFTVEALSSLPDTRLTAVGPDGRTWREKAKAYVENSKSAAYATSLAAELQRTKDDLAGELERSKALSERVTALEAAASGQTEAPPRTSADEERFNALAKQVEEMRAAQAANNGAPPPVVVPAKNKGGTPPDII